MKKSRAVSVLVVDDDVANLEGIQLFLRQKGLTVYGAGRTGQALAIFEREQPQVAVLDIMLLDEGDPYTSNTAGIELAKIFRRRCPQMGIVFRSAYTHFREEILDFIQDGYGGIVYLFKGGGDASRLLDAVQTAYTGGIYIDPRVVASAQPFVSTLLDVLPAEEHALVEALLSRFDILTPREIEVLKRLTWSRRTIAGSLHISERTVDRHISNIYAKLNLTHADQPKLRQDVVLSKAYMIHRLQEEAHNHKV